MFRVLFVVLLLGESSICFCFLHVCLCILVLLSCCCHFLLSLITCLVRSYLRRLKLLSLSCLLLLQLPDVIFCIFMFFLRYLFLSFFFFYFVNLCGYVILFFLLFGTRFCEPFLVQRKLFLSFLTFFRSLLQLEF